MLFQGLGLEHVGRGAILVLARQLGPYVDQVAAEWTELDIELADELERIDLRTVDLRTPQKSDLFVGHHPETLELPYEGFPTIAAMGYQAQAAPDAEQGDQYDAQGCTLFVEVFEASHDIDRVNSRIQRLTDAVHRCIRANSSLNNTVEGLSRRPPRVNVGDVQDGKDAATSRSETPWYYQGARLEYTATTYHVP